MRRYLPFVVALVIGLGLSVIIIHGARADGDIPPPSPADCAPIVLNQYGSTDAAGSADSTGNLGEASDSIVAITWGDADGDGNSGDEIITTQTITGYSSTGQPIYESSQTVVLAEWSTTCQVQQTCTDSNSSGGGGSGGNGDNSGCNSSSQGGGTGTGGGTGNCATPNPCGGDMSGGSSTGGSGGNGTGNCATPGPCSGDMSGGSSTGGSGGNGTGNCATPSPCDSDMSGGSGGGSSGGGGGSTTNCVTPTPCANGGGTGTGSGGSSSDCNNTTTTNGNSGPSWVVNPDVDAPPDCALIQVTEYGMKCYPTCSTSTTEGGVACLGVQREPYPRGLVGVPNVYIVNGPFSKDGNSALCPDPNLEYPLYRNRSLQVVWEMDLTIPPAWFFDERAWNIQKGVSNQAFGFEVEHTFETSSYPTFTGDKPYVGPSTTNELLPAYLVRVDTWWKGYVVREWDEYYWNEKREDYSCDPTRLNADGSKADPNCGADGIGSRLISRDYEFKGHITAKDEIDLRTWGWPTAELYSRNAWDPRQSVIGIPPQYICRYIPTPILEAQSVLTTGSDGNAP